MTAVDVQAVIRNAIVAGLMKPARSDDDADRLTTPVTQTLARERVGRRQALV